MVLKYEQQEGFEPLPTRDFYRTAIDVIKVKEISHPQYGDSVRLDFRLKVLDGDYATRVIFHSTSTKLGESNSFGKSKLLQIVELYNPEFKSGDELNLEDLLGTVIEVLLTEPNDKGYQKVEKVRKAEDTTIPDDIKLKKEFTPLEEPATKPVETKQEVTEDDIPF